MHYGASRSAARESVQGDIEQGYALSETAYSYGYDLRLKYSSFMRDTLEWISHNISALLPNENNKILSLGCGSGIFDIELLKTLQDQGKKWFFKGVDFSARDLELFRRKLESLDPGFQRKVSLEYRKFTASVDLQDDFDLILMVHFLHSFDDVLPIIDNALRHLSENGRLLIVQQNDKGMAELKGLFSDLLPNRKFHSSVRIKTLLESRGLSFASCLIDSSFDVSILKKMSLDALVLMSFCLTNDLSVLNARQQDAIRNAFLSRAREGENGSLIIDEQMELIVVHT